MQTVFYEGYLTDYEKTIYSMAIAHGSLYTYILEDEDINGISSLLSVDYELFRKAINLFQDGLIPATEIKLGDTFYDASCFSGAELLNALLRIYFIYKSLRGVSNGTEKDDVLKNIRIFQGCIGEFNSINASTATFECISRDYFTMDLAIYNNSEYNPRNQLTLLHYFVTDDTSGMFDRAYLPFLYRIISYEFLTRINSIYLITVTQIVKHSRFMREDIKHVAEEMYSYLLSMLQNARLISVQTNHLYPTRADDVAHRGRENNTTRLQVLYGYENYDAYFLRLDLAHKGQGFVHYNNESPGGVKSCLFSKREYEVFVSQYPVSRDFFIQYGNRYALKERVHLGMTEETEGIFEEIRKTKEHLEAFDTNYGEETVVEFMNVVSAMLPQECVVGIDVEEEHARYCFHYDKIMFNAVLLDLAFLSRDADKIKKAIERIVALASGNGLVSEDMADELYSIEGVCLIIDEAKNRIPLYRGIL